MMGKANQTFNFANISKSLYELYATRFGQTQDKDVVARMMLLRKSKSALLSPLLSSEDQLIGSLEMYRFTDQPFDKELESRIQVFTT